MIGLKKIEDTWVVCKFVEDQNHELLTPKSTSMLRGHRVITNAQRNFYRYTQSDRYTSKQDNVCVK